MTLATPAPTSAPAGADALPAVATSGLTCHFGDVHAVEAVELEIPAGAICGLLGPDGAGKSTLIRMLATVQRPTYGDAKVFGESVRHAAGRVTPRLGYMAQRFSMYPDLTVAENIDFFATIRGVAPAERRTRAHDLLVSMGLDEFAGRQAGKLSGGMKQKLMLAATLMHEPDLLLLDEPTTGVDPVSRREFWRILAELHRAGKTVLVATPYMDEAERCTQVVFMDGGRIQQEGTPGQIKDLVPGTLLEATCENPRDILGHVAELPRVLGSHLYGDVVRVLWDAERDRDEAADELRRALAGAGVTASVRAVPVDMETAFAHLADATPRRLAPEDQGLEAP